MMPWWRFIRAFWYISNNFGDNINYDIIRHLSGREPVYDDQRDDDHFIVCGSILSEANEHSIVWGAGYGASYCSTPQPKEVHAVRGHLSAERLGVSVPVGDPSMVIRNYYDPTRKVQFEEGIIPHWKDLETVIRMDWGDGVKIINPLKPYREVINDILSCEKIYSSGLHGLILSDVYEVPNAWVDFGNDIGGDWFKFMDYYSTTDTPEQGKSETLWEAKPIIHRYKYSMDDFIKSCPFYERTQQ